MAEATKNKSFSSHCWWLDRNNDFKQKSSPWLQSQISELNEKTKAILELIDADADSFAQRAELYFQKRPQLINLVEDLYHFHRALAARCDHLRSHSLSSTSYTKEKEESENDGLMKLREEKNRINQENEAQKEPLRHKEEEKRDLLIEEKEGIPLADAEEIESEKEARQKVELLTLREEMERVKEENGRQEEELRHRDEEKREVIRQLSLGMDLLREENVCLRQKAAAIRGSQNRRGAEEFMGNVDRFCSQLFRGSAKLLSSCPLLL